MERTYEVEVTEEDIVAALKTPSGGFLAVDCPVAQAVRRATGEEAVVIASDLIRIDGKPFWAGDPRVDEMIDWFDSKRFRKPGLPFTFNLRSCN